jgi:hypothetical protein
MGAPSVAHPLDVAVHPFVVQACAVNHAFVVGLLWRMAGLTPVAEDDRRRMERLDQRSMRVVLPG